MKIPWATVAAFVIGSLIVIAVTPYVTKMIKSSGAWEGLDDYEGAETY